MCVTTIAVATLSAHAQIAELLVVIGNSFCLRGWSLGSPKQMSACVISSLLCIARTQKLPLIDLTVDVALRAQKIQNPTLDFDERHSEAIVIL